MNEPNQIAKLNLGCGQDLRPPPWVNVDIIVPSATRGILFIKNDLRLGKLDFACDSSYDEVLLELVLEHLWPSQINALLDEVHRVLIPGGVVRVVVPDGEEICRAWLEGAESWSKLCCYIYGEEGKQEDDTIHKHMFTDTSLSDALRSAGFVCTTCEDYNDDLMIRMSAINRK